MRESKLVAYLDADWAGDSFDRRSHGGQLVFWGENLIFWSSRKQPTVARSSKEAEYRLADAASKVNWIEMVLKELGISVGRTSMIRCDNISTNYLTKNPIFHARTKHVAIRSIGSRVVCSKGSASRLVTL